jgi:hypothetical protein
VAAATLLTMLPAQDSSSPGWLSAGRGGCLRTTPTSEASLTPNMPPRRTGGGCGNRLGRCSGMCLPDHPKEPYRTDVTFAGAKAVGNGMSFGVENHGTESLSAELCAELGASRKNKVGWVARLCRPVLGTRYADRGTSALNVLVSCRWASLGSICGVQSIYRRTLHEMRLC